MILCSALIDPIKVDVMSNIETYEFMVEGVLMMVVTCVGIFFNIIRLVNFLKGLN